MPTIPISRGWWKNCWKSSLGCRQTSKRRRRCLPNESCLITIGTIKSFSSTVSLVCISIHWNFGMKVPLPTYYRRRNLPVFVEPEATVNVFFLKSAICSGRFILYIYYASYLLIYILYYFRDAWKGHDVSRDAGLVYIPYMVFSHH